MAASNCFRVLAWMSALAAGPALAAAAPSEPVPAVLYRDATLIDGTGSPARPHMDVLVRGERIEAIGDDAHLQAPAEAKVVDVSGLYVLPGLINSHVHLATPPDRPLAEARLAKEVYGGVTAVRAMADDLRQVADLARAARVGEIPGPDIAYAALMAGPQFFLDPRTHETTAGAVAGQTPWMRAVTADTDLRMAVAEARGTGAMAIKIYADLPAERVEAITREAHRQGALVWAHAAVFPASPAEVVGAAVDSVSHACLLGYQVSAEVPRDYSNRAPVDAAAVAGSGAPVIGRLLEEMKRRGVVLDATLRVHREMEAAYAAHPSGGPLTCTLATAVTITRQAYREGVLISAGTDGFSRYEDPWPSLQDELELLQDRVGMRPADVIRSATLVGAMTMHEEAEMGTLAPGKLANLVFTADDPLKDVRALRTVRLTVKRGRPYWRRDYRPPVGPPPGSDAEG